MKCLPRLWCGRALRDCLWLVSARLRSTIQPGSLVLDVAGVQPTGHHRLESHRVSPLQGPMVRWLVAKGARVTPHELELAAFGGYELPAAQMVT